MDYKKAGVDRIKEEQVVRSILEIAKTTKTYDDGLTGHYAGSIKFGDHLLSLATDGVGSKVLLAQEYQEFKSVGIDCVAMNVNDLIAIGSIPQAFVDYIAIQQPNELILTQIVSGIAEACKEANIPLIGGETAILPDVIQGDGTGFDVAGTALGIHKIGESITGEKIEAGDIIIGVESSGIHSNGLSLARKVFLESENELKKQLLVPTRIYVSMVKELLDNVSQDIHGMAHITGGGFTNLLRLGNYRYELKKWSNIPQIFDGIQIRGKISFKEMYRTFNMGIGYIVITKPQSVQKILEICNKHYSSTLIGEVLDGSGVFINNIEL